MYIFMWYCDIHINHSASYTSGKVADVRFPSIFQLTWFSLHKLKKKSIISINILETSCIAIQWCTNLDIMHLSVYNIIILLHTQMRQMQIERIVYSNIYLILTHFWNGNTLILWYIIFYTFLISPVFPHGRG